MNTLKTIIFFFTIGLIISACSDDSNLNFPNSFPTVYIEEGNSFDLQVGKVLTVHVIIESKTIMETMEVYKNGNLFQSISLEPSSNIQHQYLFQGVKADAGFTHTLTFVVIDEEGVGAARSIGVGVYETPLEYTTSGSISNANGNGIISWDLVSNDGGLSTNKIDILNSSTPISSWVKGWKSTTLTHFVKLNSAPSIPFNDLTMEDVIALYQPNAEVSEVGLETGDWVIAKLRDTEEYAIIRIDQVDEASNNSTEMISFTYKKSYEFAGRR